MNINQNDYIHIEYWMIDKLKLKGNDLLVYAIIYGFSRAENQYFYGNRRYIAEFIGSTIRGVQTNLNNLLSAGLIEKHVKMEGNERKVFYRVQDTWKEKKPEISEDVNPEVGKPQECEKPKEEKHAEEIKAIVSYLNKRAGTNFRANTEAAKRHINARLNEGFTLNDFYTVIDRKCAEWLGGNMQQYIRPETLFGSKFEGYLQHQTAPVTGACGVKYAPQQTLPNAEPDPLAEWFY